MPSYLTPLDIGNRALQHCGATRIDSFEEESKNAAEISQCYDKLRESELRRNIWKFAIKTCVLRPVDDTFRMLRPPLWSGLTTYRLGALVTDVRGTVWINMVTTNLNRAPGWAPGWEMYFGPLVCPEYDATETYYVNDVVYTTPGDGTYKVYISLANDNTDDPSTLAAWASTTRYRKGDLASVSSTPYLSLIDFNQNQNPATTAQTAWASGTTYSAGQKAMGSDGYTYTSIAGGNLGNDPTLDFTAAYWTKGSLTPWTTATDTRGTGSTKWQVLDVALDDIAIEARMRMGPDFAAKSRYRLPANFLRMAPQNPKAGSISPLGAPAGERFRDWDFQGQWIITCENAPIVFRFVADFSDVASMDALFCEGLAARIGYEVCEPLTQNKQTKGNIAAEYQKFMGEARIVNGIETGPVQPPEDDWVTCRL